MTPVAVSWLRCTTVAVLSVCGVDELGGKLHHDVEVCRGLLLLKPEYTACRCALKVPEYIRLVVFGGAAVSPWCFQVALCATCAGFMQPALLVFVWRLSVPPVTPRHASLLVVQYLSALLEAPVCCCASSLACWVVCACLMSVTLSLHQPLCVLGGCLERCSACLCLCERICARTGVRECHTMKAGLWWCCKLYPLALSEASVLSRSHGLVHVSLCVCFSTIKGVVGNAGL